MIPREELMRVRRLASKANPRVKDWSGLGDRDNRDRLRLTLAEGARLVAEGLESSAAGFFRPAAFLVSDSGAQRPEAGALFAAAGERGVDRFSLSDECFAKISGLKGSDGIALVLAFADGEPDIPQLLAHPGAKWLAAAGVQDPGNAGALARTALAAGATGCLFIGGVDPKSPKFLRGGMGAAFRLPCLPLDEEAFLAGLGSASGTRVVMAAAGGVSCADYRGFDYRSPIVLLLGGERGVPDTLAARADASVRIPLKGGVESLNLAVAAGIILFEAERRREATDGAGS